jgi:hypothetical protein
MADYWAEETSPEQSSQAGGRGTREHRPRKQKLAATKIISTKMMIQTQELHFSF